MSVPLISNSPHSNNVATYSELGFTAALWLKRDSPMCTSIDYPEAFRSKQDSVESTKSKLLIFIILKTSVGKVTSMRIQKQHAYNIRNIRV